MRKKENEEAGKTGGLKRKWRKNGMIRTVVASEDGKTKFIRSKTWKETE